MIVIDAGSSESRLHVYTYTDTPSSVLPEIEQVYIKKIQPGFASIQATPDMIAAYLQELFSDVSVQNIPVYFYATAGMRLLPEALQKLYYQNLEAWFQTQPQWPLKADRTISGQEEAVLGWLAVNQKIGTLGASALIGSMDIGGASTQIVFPLHQGHANVSPDHVHLEVMGQPVDIFAHSFLGFGVDVVRQKNQNTPSCFPINYPLGTNDSGQGDGYICAQSIGDLLRREGDMERIVRSDLDNNPTTAWYMIGAVSSLAHRVPFSYPEEQLTAEDLLQQANQKLCQKSWLELQNTLQALNPYVAVNCLVASYYYALTVTGYGFTPTQTMHLLPEEKDSDWTTGVVLDKGTHTVTLPTL